MLQDPKITLYKYRLLLQCILLLLKLSFPKCSYYSTNILNLDFTYVAELFIRFWKVVILKNEKIKFWRHLIFDYFGILMTASECQFRVNL